MKTRSPRPITALLLSLFAFLSPSQSPAQYASGDVVLGWGQNYAGESAPPGDATNIIQISAGYNHTLAVRTDGTVDAWGLSELGATSVPAGLSNVIAVAAGDNHSLALQSNGTVVAWGYNGYGQATVPAGLSNVVAIAAGDFFSLALVKGGTVAAWGDDANEQVLEASYASGIAAIAASPINTSYAMGLKTDGTVVEWGLYVPSIPSNATNVIQIAVGGAHYMALKADGTVVVWGDNTYGQTNVPPGLSNVVAIAAGWYNSMALQTNGTVIVWGGNTYGEGVTPYALSNVTAISSGGGFNLALNNGLPCLVAWPTNQSVYTGMPVTFYAATPSYPVPLSFQWQFNGTNLNGATGNVLNLTNVSLADAGNYSVVVTNVYGAITSSPAVLTVISSGPVIVQQPLDQTVAATSNATFSVNAVGSWPLSYQWQCNSTNVPGATNNTLLISNAQLGHAGSVFYVVITNSVNSIVSSNAVLNVAPAIVAIQPQNLTTNGGANVTFTSTVVGAGPFAYQWQFNSTNLLGQTNGTLSLANVLDTQSGPYSLTVSNAFGVVVSSNAPLTVVPWISISVSPSTLTYGAGTLLIISFNVGGLSQPLNYQWTQNGNPWGGPNPGGASETINPPMSFAGTYTVTASDPYVTLTTNASLTIIPLAITNQPPNAYAWTGSTAQLKVSAIGVPPLSYQWQFNGTNIPAPNANPLLLTNAQPSQFGQYDVIVSNSYTNITSGATALSLSQVAVWGGADGEANLTSNLTGIVAISGGQSSLTDCQALKSNGVAITWPSGIFLPVAKGSTNLISIAGGDYGYGLTKNGLVTQWPSDGSGIVPGLSNVVAISAFPLNLLAAVNSNGIVVAPTPPAGLSNVVAVAEGGQFTLALTARGTVTAWGNNANGQCNVPLTLSNVIAIAAGDSHSLALKANGTVIGWGLNNYGQTKVPSGLGNVIAIAAGSYHSLALTANGTVVAWGNNVYGQTNVPSGLTNVIAIAAGEYHSMALIGNGPPVSQAPLANPQFGANHFSLSLPTQSGRVYVLQYQASLSSTNWLSLPLVPGNGGTVTLTDSSATNSQRFYRVQRW